MPFTIPKAADAAFADQAQVDPGDLAILHDGFRFTGVVSGCAVTTTGTGNGSVTVASGRTRHTDLINTVAGGTVAITANASGNPRYDLITVTSANALAAVAGTAAAAPVFPSIPAGSVVLAAVRVPTGHTGTSTVAANTIVDKRVVVPDMLDGGTVSGVPFEHRIQHEDPAKIAFYVKGVIDPGAALKPIFQVDDYLANPIHWVAPVGGAYTTDDVQTAFTVFGPYYNRWDVYGFQWRNRQATFAFPGPPGNMLSWPDAVHEVYQSTRAQTTSSWGVVGACTIAAQDLGVNAPYTSPTGYRTAIRITNTTGGTAWIATPGGASAYDGVTPGDIIAPVYWIKSNSAAAARNAQVRITWLTSAGATVGSDITSGTISVPNTGAWTRIFMTGQTAPATAARVQMSILVASLTGETHDVCGAGLMRGDNDGTFAPPFWGQEQTYGTTKVGGYANVGDRWVRTDTAAVPGMREYVCRVGGAPKNQYWDPIDTSTVVRLRADQAFTTTTLANVNTFSFNLISGREYQFDVSIVLRSAATTTGWQVGWAASGGLAFSSFLSVCEFQSSATAWTTNTITSVTMPANHTATSAAYAANTNILMRIRAHGIASASGNLQFTARTAVASSAITVLRGSTFTVT